MLSQGLRKKLDHRFTQKNLSAYADGELAIGDRERIERHLTACSECRRELAELRATKSVLSAAPRLQVPRSFTLPASVQGEQGRFRFWQTSHTVLQGAAVALSFLLVLFISGEALLRFGVLPIGRMGSQVKTEALDEAAEVEQTVLVELESEKVAEAPEKAAGGAPTVAATPWTEESAAFGVTEEPVAMVKEGETVQEAAVQEEAIEEEDAAQGPTEESDQSPPMMLEVVTQEPGPVYDVDNGEAVITGMTARGGEGMSTTEPVTLALAATPTEQQNEVALPTLTPTPTLPSATPTLALPAATPTALPTATAMPTATPTVSPTASLQSPALGGAEVPPTAAPSPIHTVDSHYALQPRSGGLWRIWSMVRVSAGIMAGVLLILLGGLVWTGHKRRPY